MPSGDTTAAEKLATTTSSGSSTTTAAAPAATENHHDHGHGLHLHLPHPHGAEHHDGHTHFHPRPHTHHHTVLHAIRSAHPPHTHAEVKTRKHLVARPRARQYFTENGDLHKQCDDGIPRQAGKFELFLDLLYIGLCANFAEDMIHHPTSGVHLLKYILIFVPAWRIWSDLTTTMNSYYNDDVVQRVLIVWIMILMTLYGNNAIYIDVNLDALRVCVGTFMTARVSIAFINLFYSITVHHHATQLRIHSIIVLLILPLWTPLFLPTSLISNRLKVGLAVLAFGLDQASGGLPHTTWFKRIFKQQYSSAVDIDHHADRMAAFFIIVLGEFLYGLVWASPAGLDGLGEKFGRAAMSLVVAFCLCWLYTSCDGSRENPETGVHALRWKAINGILWIMLHLPLSAALLIAGDICAVFVKYGDTGVGTKAYYSEEVKRAVEGGEEKFPTYDDWQPLRWLFCGGLAIGILCLYWISILHHEADEDDETRCILFMPQLIRRFPRLPVGIITACLPLASPEKLSITSLMAIVTAMLLFLLVWEMIGGLDKNWTWVEGGKDVFCDEEQTVVFDDGKPAAIDNSQAAEIEMFEGSRNVVAAPREGAAKEHGIEKSACSQ